MLNKKSLTILKSKQGFNLILGALLVFAAVIHLINLVEIPVFADESIYIRWAQLIIDDWKQYLFFSLNDGKTPIFIWALVPFQYIFSDQLFAGRFLSVAAGVSQVLTVGLIIKSLRLGKKARLISMLLTAILPYWYFHHHLGLMDGMLVLWTSLACLFSIKLSVGIKQQKKPASLLLLASLVGLFIWLGILTKLPAILLIPSIILVGAITKQKTFNDWKKLTLYLFFSVLFGLTLFLFLKIHPAFSQLFTRGGDFLFDWQEILLEGRWKETIPSVPNYLSYFVQYLTWPIVFFSILGIFLKQKRPVILMHLSWLTFAIPIFVMGKVVFARYLFPVSLFITLAATLSIGQLINMKGFVKYIAYALLFLAVIKSSQFISSSLFSPENIPFIPSDQKQYLTEWSAGYGVKETVELIEDLSGNQVIYVMSEGYFGTLPDGLLMYLHREPVDNIFIQPIGQPIRTLPAKQSIRNSEDFDRFLLVGNSHRLLLNLEKASLIYEYCRPFDSPCHQVWDVTNLINSTD